MQNLAKMKQSLDLKQKHKRFSSQTIQSFINNQREEESVFKHFKH